MTGSESKIERQSLGDQVLEQFVANDYNFVDTASKFKGLTAKDIANYIENVKVNESERWAKVIQNSEIDVVRKISGIITRVENKLDLWENKEDKEAKYLMAIREARDNLKFYVDCLEKIYTQKQAIAFRRAVLDIIREIDPSVAQKIIEKIKTISDLNKLLGT